MRSAGQSGGEPGGEEGPGGRGQADGREEYPGPLRELWSRFVLLRPGMGMDDLRQSTKLRTARSWSWEERTPGTARTIAFTVGAVTLFAVPALLRNPAVFSYLLEAADLSVQGVGPVEFWSDVLKRAVGMS